MLRRCLETIVESVPWPGERSNGPVSPPKRTERVTSLQLRKSDSLVDFTQTVDDDNREKLQQAPRKRKAAGGGIILTRLRRAPAKSAVPGVASVFTKEGTTGVGGPFFFGWLSALPPGSMRLHDTTSYSQWEARPSNGKPTVRWQWRMRGAPPPPPGLHPVLLSARRGFQMAGDEVHVLRLTPIVCDASGTRSFLQRDRGLIHLPCGAGKHDAK